MNIKYHSAVIITDHFDRMKSFYQKILNQEIEMDFGNCISFKQGLSIWKLECDYPIAQTLGRTFHADGNKNLEICFETDDFDKFMNSIKNEEIKYLHKETEEKWGQRTIRFFDPDNNLIEVGESIPCFVQRFYKQGLSIKEVSKRTSVPADIVNNICQSK